MTKIRNITSSVDINEYLICWAKRDGQITNWHLNNKFLSFCDDYGKGKTLKQCQRLLVRHASKLVKRGILNRCEKIGIGAGAMNEFGSRTQSIWTIKATNHANM